MRDQYVTFRVTRLEKEQLRLAAGLSHVSVVEYMRRAINRELRRQGVDAVLFPERESAALPPDQEPSKERG